MVEELRRQEEAERWAKAVSLGKQGQWPRWENVERRRLSWKDAEGPWNQGPESSHSHQSCISGSREKQPVASAKEE